MRASRKGNQVKANGFALLEQLITVVMSMATDLAALKEEVRVGHKKEPTIEKCKGNRYDPRPKAKMQRPLE